MKKLYAAFAGGYCTRHCERSEAIHVIIGLPRRLWRLAMTAAFATLFAIHNAWGADLGFCGPGDGNELCHAGWFCSGAASCEPSGQVCNDGYFCPTGSSSSTGNPSRVHPTTGSTIIPDCSTIGCNLDSIYYCGACNCIGQPTPTAGSYTDLKWTSGAAIQTGCTWSLKCNSGKQWTGSDCTNCASGTAGGGATVTNATPVACGTCGANTFSPGGIASCINCDTANGYTTSGATGASKCTRSCTVSCTCNPEPAKAAGVATHSCNAASNPNTGGTQDQTGANIFGNCTGAQNACAWTVNSCSGGWGHSNVGNGSCTGCTAGNFSPGGTSACASCGSNSTSGPNASACNCAAGHSPTGAWGGGTTTAGGNCSIMQGTITYNPNGGTGSTAASTHQWGAAKTLTANGFANGTNRFIGWNAASGATTAAYANEQSVTFTDTAPPTNLYAIWQACSCTGNSATVNCSPNNLSAPATACACTSGCKTGYEGGTPNTCGHTCAAKTYTVALDANGGTAGTTTSVTATYNASLPAIAPADLPTRAGHTFNGFFSATSGGTKYINANGTSNTAATWTTDGGGTLYAQWSACGAGSGTNGTIHMIVDDNQCKYYITCNTGYEYGANSIATAVTTSNLTCNPICYTISTANKNGGSGGTDTIYLKYNTGWGTVAGCGGTPTGTAVPIGGMTPPTRLGHGFTGYWTSAAGGTKIIDSDLSPTGLTNTTTPLYAQWSANTYPITLNKNGGTGNIQSGGTGNTPGATTSAGTAAATHSCVFGQPCTLPATSTLTRAGYARAAEWCTTAAGTGAGATCYPAGTEIANSDITAPTLWAKWTICGAGTWTANSASCEQCPSNTTSAVGATASSQCYIPTGAKFRDANNSGIILFEDFFGGAISGDGKCYYNPE